MGTDLLYNIMDCVSDHLQGILPDDVELMFNIDNSISFYKQYRYRRLSLCNIGFTNDYAIIAGGSRGLWTDVDGSCSLWTDVGDQVCYHVYYDDPDMFNIIDDFVLFFVIKNSKSLA